MATDSISPGSKRCYNCTNVKSLDNFGKDKSRSDGKNPLCKECRNKAGREQNKGRKEYFKQYYLKTWDKQRARRVEQRAQRAEYNRSYKGRAAEWRKNRRATDPEWKLHQRVRHRIQQALKKGQGLQKSASTLELLGLPPSTARRWIEFQFEPGMSWDNHGTTWELDHVLPLSRFDFSKEEEQRVAFHWTNLQPKGKQSNRSKHNKIRPSELFNVQLSAISFIRQEGLGSREYQGLGESTAWLRATTSDMVTTSWMTEGF